MGTFELDNASINVFDISGRVVKRYSNIQDSRVNFDLSDVSMGTYVVEVYVNGTRKTQKVNINR